MNTKEKIGKLLDKFVESKKDEGIIYYSIDSLDKFISHYIKFDRKTKLKIKLYKKKDKDESNFSEYLKSQRILAIKANCDWYGEDNSDLEYVKKSQVVDWLDKDNVSKKELLKKAKEVKDDTRTK